MEDLRAITELLGGAPVLGGALRSPIDLVHRVREGFSSSTVDHLAERLEVTAEDLRKLAGILRRAHDGRKKNEQDRLKPSESEGVLRIARVAVRAAEVLGDLKAAHRWLRTKNAALGGRTPMSLLDTKPGAELVTAVLERVEYGVYS